MPPLECVACGDGLDCVVQPDRRFTGHETIMVDETFTDIEWITRLLCVFPRTGRGVNYVGRATRPAKADAANPRHHAAAVG
jgi:hypothetical protein